jgi:signal recognition particle subunit SRP54
MFETLSKGFRTARQSLSGQVELNEHNIDNALREVRVSLLEADVEYNVVTRFLNRVKTKALGKKVSTSIKDKSGQKLRLKPAEHFIGICYEELEALMGPVDTSIKLSRPVGTVMMVGLQGTGKTTTTGKIAQYLLKKKLSPMLVAADIYRPAAVLQLKVLGESLKIPVFADPTLLPPQLCAQALIKAKEWQCNVVIFDTAGRLSIDDDLMHELEEIKHLTQPDNIFLVVDAMIGQDAVRTAAEFNRRLNIDGFILTKLDGDARGGAALSIKEITSKPIKFLGMGEKLGNLEEFRPEGLASRILGMGDIVSLVKDFEEHVSEEKAEQDAKRMLKGRFTLQDFLDQLLLLKKMGPLQSIMEKMPGMSEMRPQGGINEREFMKLEAIVQSMTLEERAHPELIERQKNRRKRIAQGAGRKEFEVDALLKKFSVMRTLLQTVGKKPGILGQLPGFKQLGQMATISKDFNELLGNMSSAPPGAMGSMPSGFFSTPRTVTANFKSSKDKKDKRKREKIARKKNKKRK